MNETQHTMEHLAPHAAPQVLPATAELGAVHLDVTGAQNSRLFWTHYVGLTLLSETEERIELGVGKQTLIVLHPGASGPVVPKHTGLYHVALHVPTRKDLARVVARLFAVGWQNSPTDHTETMATYLSDPDGNGIEITFETPERGHLVRDTSRFAAMLADGTLRGATEALDVEDLLSALTEDDDLTLPMSEGTRIGHVHLHVRDIDEARRFYREVIGFGDMRAFDRYGMSDFSLDTSFVPHALAVNVWNGRQAEPRPEGTAGLRSWSVMLPDVASLDALQQRLANADYTFERDGNVLHTRDPFGNPLIAYVED
ncbi:MAG: VOC family protein [Thermomicrobiales bacterium]|nr:VOC family protein [Thermomicrobiales bacterium]